MTSLARHTTATRVASNTVPGYIKKSNKTKGALSHFTQFGIDLNDTSITRPWTLDGEDALVDLFVQEGYTAKEVCKELGRTLPDVLSRLVKLALEELGPEGIKVYEGFKTAMEPRTKKVDKPSHVERVKPCKMCGGKLAYMWQEEPFKEWRECKCGYKIQAGEAG